MADLDEKALLPCPFGCSAPIGHRTTNRTVVLVCTECGACGPYEEGSAEDEAVWSRAIASWNRRAYLEATQAKAPDVVEAAREAIARKKDIDGAHHSASLVRAGKWDHTSEVQDALRGASEYAAALASLSPAKGSEGGAK